FLSGFKQRQLHGMHLELHKASVSDLMSHERFVKDQERLRIRANLERHGITLFKGHARIVDPTTVSVTPGRCPEVMLKADRILIPTGSYRFRPEGFPFHNPSIYDSDTILLLENIPPSLVVVGGGVIGCEYACMFNALGVQVTVIEKRGSILGGMD